MSLYHQRSVRRVDGSRNVQQRLDFEFQSSSNNDEVDDDVEEQYGDEEERGEDEDDDNEEEYVEEDDDDDDEDNDDLGDNNHSGSQDYYYESNASPATAADDEYYHNNRDEVGSPSFSSDNNNQVASSSSVSSDNAAAGTTASTVVTTHGRSRSSAAVGRGNYGDDTPARTSRVRGSTRSTSTTAATPTGASSGTRSRTSGTTQSATTPTTGTAVAAAATTISASSSASPPPTSKLIHAVESLDVLYKCPRLREVAGTSTSSSEALSWQLSSAKPGNGVEQLRHSSIETYWQSDGVVQPHWIQIHFQRRIAISHVCLYLDYHLDESYTPKTITIEVGMTAQDLTTATSPIPKIEFHEPSGWCIIPLCAPPDPLDGSDFYDDDNHNHFGDDDDDDDNNHDRNDDDDDDISRSRKEEESALEKHFQKPLLKAHMIRISILSMHQNGRDTHVRRLALFARQQQHHQFPQQPAVPLQTISSNVSHSLKPSSQLALGENLRHHNNINNPGQWSENITDNDHPENERSLNPISSIQPWYAESWNHHRNSASPDFTTLGRNTYSTIR